MGSISAPLKKHIMTTKLLITPNGFLEAIQRPQWHNLYVFITCKFFIGQMLSIELFKLITALAWHPAISLSFPPFSTNLL